MTCKVHIIQQTFIDLKMFTAQTLGSSQQSFIPGGSAPRSNPLPEKVPLSYNIIPFIDKN